MSASDEPIAITGMGCLFPGAPDVSTYWSNICGKVDSVTDPPPESWDPDVYYDPTFTDKDRTYCKKGGYLGSLAKFDPLEFGIPPMSVGGEPDQWLALKVASDALRDAGALDLPEEIRHRTAIVLGKGTYLNGGNAIAVQRGLVVGQTINLLRKLRPDLSEPELAELRKELQGVLPEMSADKVPGLIPNIIVGRIANRLDLMGPAYTVDGACASSLLAIQQAVRDLRDGHADLALAGGAQVWMPVATLNVFSKLGALSKREQIAPFSKNADGTLLGEGIGMVVLKRLSDAERDGDRIYATLRGVGVSSDGKSKGVMAPRGEGQVLALRRAYESVGVSPTSIGLIEAHGTGTTVGDKTEVESLRTVFGERSGAAPRTAIGTVKSMISHTIPAAGVAAVMKTALALHHRVLPPHLHCEEPDPALGLDDSPFYVNTETRPWIHGGAEPRRAGVNAFGFGGINAHAILEAHDEAPNPDHRPPWDSELFVLEAADAEALADRADELRTALEGKELRTADLAYTLATELADDADGVVRLAVVAESLEDLRGKLEAAAGRLRKPGTKRIRATNGTYYAATPLGRDGKVAVVFPGEGAQYPNMLKDLCLHFDEAREKFDRIDRIYADHPRGDLLSDWVFPSPTSDESAAEERLNQLDIAVESLLTANAACHAVIANLVPTVDAVVGHSSGEHSAALVSGVLDVDADDDLRAFSQGLFHAYEQAEASGKMARAVLLAVGAGSETVNPILEEAGGEGTFLAMDNCPHQAVVVAVPEVADKVQELCRRDSVVCEVLPFDRAVHTPLFAPFAEGLRAVFDKLPIGAADEALWSCTTGGRYPTGDAAVRQLLVDHWTHPVKFRETIEALHADGVRVFIEAGPRGGMTAFVEDILRGKPSVALPMDLKQRSGTTQLNHVVGQLLVHGVPVRVAHLWGQRNVEVVDWRAPVEEPAKDRSLPLSTRWPMMDLDDETVARFAPAPNGNGHVASNGNGAPSAAPAPAAAPPAAVVAAPAAATPGVRPGPGAPGVLAGHLERMESFLSATQQVMTAYLGAAPAAGPAAPVAPQTGPLLGDLVAHEPGVRLVAHRRVDPATDAALRDHTLGRDVARSDPGLTGLAMLPLTSSLETLAEAADALVPDRIVVGLKDVRAHRWLAFGETPQTLETTAVLQPDGSVKTTIRSLEEGPASPAAEATVVLADAYPAAPDPLPLDLQGAEPARWAPGELYGDDMFHGPIWQGVSAMDQVAPKAATGRLRVPQAPAGWVLDPVVLDAAGQVVGFWAAQRLAEGKVVFPFRMAELSVHGPRPAAGTEIGCTADVAMLGDQLLRSDLDVLGADGRVWMRLKAWEDKRFHVPDRLRPLTIATALPPLSEPWPAAAASLDRPMTVVRRMTATLPSDAALWEPAWAGRVLGRAERRRLRTLQRPAPRRHEWLAARTAAKEAVVGLLAEHMAVEVLPADVELLPDEHGRPRVHVPGVEGVQVVVSLAHSGGEAAAIAALTAPGTPLGIGIDVEPVRELPDEFAATALTADEQRLLDGVDAARRDEWLLRAWCAKEAAAKAAGTGFDPGPSSAALESLDGEGSRAVVVAAEISYTVSILRDGDLVVATTTGPSHDREPEHA